MANLYGRVGRECFLKLSKLFVQEREGEISSAEAEAAMRAALVADGMREVEAESLASWIITVARDLEYSKPAPEDYGEVNGLHFRGEPYLRPVRPS